MTGMDLTLYLYGEEGMFVVFHWKKMGHRGCQKDWCDKWNNPSFMLTPLLMMMIPAHGEVHWAYDPDPPLIHPAVWSRLEILLLGAPWTESL